MTHRRHLTRVLFALALGVLVSTLIAWGCALFVENDDGSEITPEAFLRGEVGSVGRLARTMDWPVPVPSSWDDNPHLASRRAGFGMSIVRYANWAGGSGQQLHYTYSAGWPMTSHRATLFHEKPRDLSPGWVLKMYEGRPLALLNCGLPSRWTPDWAYPAWDNWDNEFEWRRIPLTPVWPGFAANALAYGVCVWVLLGVWGAVRRWNRSRTGRCPRCAYRRDSLPPAAPCPECGCAPRVHAS